MKDFSNYTGRFTVGIVLISGSFLVYLAYPVILLALPFPATVKIGMTVVIWVLSWGVFSVGIFLSGPDGIEWFRGLWKRTTTGNAHEKRI